MRKFFTFLTLLLLAAALARADESVRQVQEELRKRNLYFGDIDGQMNSGLENALRRYQARKGFTVTGAVDPTTAASLQVAPEQTADAPELPDTPVLKNDFAPQLAEAQRAALEAEAEAKPDPDAVPTPVPPAEPPSFSQDIPPQRVTELVENYLRASETDDVAAQTAPYFAYPVDYFGHGQKDEDFITRDVRNYVRRWPERRYRLLGPVRFAASGEDAQTNIQFEIAFDVANSERGTRAQGRTLNYWTVRPVDGQLRITSIKEERLRE